MMDTITLTPATAFHGDGTLAAVLAALQPLEDLALILDYGGRPIQPGYHVTEVKAGSFVTLDCGGDPDAWLETILQVEDLPASAEKPTHMTVGKFVSIISKVAQKLPLGDTARLTFEVGPPGQPMQIFDVEELWVAGDSAVLRFCARSAICKPRHRAQAQAAATCCGTKSCC